MAVQSCVGLNTSMPETVCSPDDGSKPSSDDGSKPSSDDGKKVDDDGSKPSSDSSTVNAIGTNEVNADGENISSELPFDPTMLVLEDDSIFDFTSDDEYDDAVADMNNLDITIQVSSILTTRIHKDHPLDQVIGDLQSATQTRKMSKNLKEHGFVSTIQQRTTHKDLQNCLFACFLSHEEPKKVIHALKDPSWIEAMQEELLQFKLVAQGRTQEEGIDYDEVFSPVARIEAIRLFLAYASFKDFVVYQMDVKSAFLYGKIEEEVYVCQPPGFEDPDFPDRVYKVEKALYGLHQAPRAWYETLSTYMLDNEFQRGKFEKNLFIKRHKGDILLVQVYVDDTIFGSTKKELCIAFEKLMHEKFQMSSMGELTFFLGLQVKQKKDGIFISQDKYVAEILKKFGFTEVKTASTLMETQKPLLKDEDGKEIDVHFYRSMIGSLMYLRSSRPDIMFVVCACARYQVNPKVSHLHAVKRIFRYLKGQPKLGLWYPKDSPFDLVAYTYSDYAGASLDRKSITRGCQFLRCRLISWQCKKQTVVANSTTEAEYVAASSCCGQVLWIQNQLLDYGVKVKPINGETHLHARVDGKKIIITESSVRRNLQLADENGIDCLPNSTIFEQLALMGKPKRKDTQIPQSSDLSGNVANEAVHMELGDRLVRPDTTASSLEAEWWSQVPRNHRDTTAQTRFESVSKHFNDLLLSKGNTLRSDKDRCKLNELMKLCTNLENRVLDLEKTKTTQAKKIASLKRRLKKLEQKKRSRTYGLKRLRKIGATAWVESSDDEESLGEDASKQGRIVAVKGVNERGNVVEEVVEVINTVKLIIDAIQVSVAGDKGCAASAPTTVSAATTTTVDDITLAQALGKGLSQDKGKGILVEPEKPLKMKYQIRLDEETALRLQAEFDEEGRLAREKAQKEEEDNIALIETWEDI
ncbi:putative ribonuclease H-like domain-containing protein [Tanacetum coccineum]